MQNKTLILGPPGTGKTTRLLSIVEDALVTIPPEKIAFISFTKKAVNEARDRAMLKFGFEEKRFPYFRTLHSLAYRQLSLNTYDMLDRNHYKSLSELTGYKLTGYSAEDVEEIFDYGDKLLFLENFSRSVKKPLRDIFDLQTVDVKWFELERFQTIYKEYKRVNRLYDFTDILEKYAQEGQPLNIEMAIIDEAQDLNSLQWDVANKALENVKNVYIAGDDDQAIFGWAGAEPHHLQNIKYTEKEVLPKSYRLPSAIFNVSNIIVNRIQKRLEKTWVEKEQGGEVLYHADPSKINFKGNWLILGRTNKLIKGFKEILEEQGILFSLKGKSSIEEKHTLAIQSYVALQNNKSIKGIHIKNLSEYIKILINIDLKKMYFKKDLGISLDLNWYDALRGIPLTKREYYRILLSKKIKLDQTPIIELSTIHGVKGGECDNVLLLSDMSARSFENLTTNPDEEHRIFYVGATRAKKALHILLPQTDLFYDLTFN